MSQILPGCSELTNATRNAIEKATAQQQEMEGFILSNVTPIKKEHSIVYIIR